MLAKVDLAHWKSTRCQVLQFGQCWRRHDGEDVISRQGNRVDWPCPELPNGSGRPDQISIPTGISAEYRLLQFAAAIASARAAATPVRKHQKPAHPTPGNLVTVCHFSCQGFSKLAAIL